MRPSTDLIGRDDLLRQVGDLLAGGGSVLLYGPEGIGKSAVVAAVARPGIHVLDPFEHVRGQAAHDIRRVLDFDGVYLAAARTAQRRALGAVGRILWRFSLVRVRELPDATLKRLVAREIGAGRSIELPDPKWVNAVVALSKGRPGFAVEMARFAADWYRRRGYWPMVDLAFAATREDATIRTLAVDRLHRLHKAPR